MIPILEVLEDRLVPSNGRGHGKPPPIVPPPPDLAQYEFKPADVVSGITFDQATGTITIQGTDGDDSATLREVSWFPGKYLAEMQTASWGVLGSTVELAVDKALVKKVVFYGYDGYDTFTNYTYVDSLQYGGAEEDQLLGGGGNDVIWGGSGEDYYLIANVLTWPNYTKQAGDLLDGRNVTFLSNV